MEESGSITLRLEVYLLQLSGLNQQWTKWLSDSEHAVLEQDVPRLQSLAPVAEQLMVELKEIFSSRASLLADAARAGLPNASLRSLARSLPAWKKPAMRKALQVASLQLSNLRRLHTAAWVLLNETTQHYRGSMELLNVGRSGQHVYMHTPKSDIGGGQLLDASL